MKHKKKMENVEIMNYEESCKVTDELMTEKSKTMKLVP